MKSTNSAEPKTKRTVNEKHPSGKTFGKKKNKKEIGGALKERASDMHEERCFEKGFSKKVRGGELKWPTNRRNRPIKTSKSRRGKKMEGRNTLRSDGIPEKKELKGPTKRTQVN